MLGETPPLHSSTPMTEVAPLGRTPSGRALEGVAASSEITHEGSIGQQEDITNGNNRTLLLLPSVDFSGFRSLVRTGTEIG
jgi:hypothetical protein